MSPLHSPLPFSAIALLAVTGISPGRRVVLDLDSLRGVALWLGGLYTNSPYLYAALVAVLLVAVGVLLGVLSEVVLEKVGLGTTPIGNQE